MDGRWKETRGSRGEFPSRRDRIRSGRMEREGMRERGRRTEREFIPLCVLRTLQERGGGWPSGHREASQGRQAVQHLVSSPAEHARRALRSSGNHDGVLSHRCLCYHGEDIVAKVSTKFRNAGLHRNHDRNYHVCRNFGHSSDIVQHYEILWKFSPRYFPRTNVHQSTR